MVKTFMAKKEAVERKWYVVDAAGKPLAALQVKWRPFFAERTSLLSPRT